MRSPTSPRLRRAEVELEGVPLPIKIGIGEPSFKTFVKGVNIFMDSHIVNFTI